MPSPDTQGDRPLNRLYSHPEGGPGEVRPRDVSESRNKWTPGGVRSAMRERQLAQRFVASVPSALRLAGAGFQVTQLKITLTCASLCGLVMRPVMPERRAPIGGLCAK